jgi:hypothetical protein
MNHVLKLLAGSAAVAAALALTAGAPLAAPPEKGAGATGPLGPLASAGRERVGSTPMPGRTEPVRKTPAEVAALIDAEIGERLAAEKVPPSPRCDDAEFCRRVHLDIVGRIPSAEEVVAFLESKDPAKRAKLVDKLLDDPTYGRHMADQWYKLIVPRETDNRRLPPEPFQDWLADNFAHGRGWDRIVYEILAADGDGASNPQVTFYLANGDMNRPAPNKYTATAGQLFLGIQIACAECHNHPFTKWKQTDFWGMAAFFGKVRFDPGAKGAMKAGNLPGVTEVVADAKAARAKGKKGGAPVPAGATIEIPESKGKVVSARYLDGDTPDLARQPAYRPALADWVTSPDNKLFAQAMVNRMWAKFFGRGFVHPVDDFHAGNPASHPVLLRALSAEFAASGFDLKHLIRCMAASETYQRSSRPVQGNEDDERLYSRMALKVMTPEVLYDSLTVALGAADKEPAAKGKKPQQGRGPGGNGRAAFAAFFDTADERADAAEYTHGIPQVLRLMNDVRFNRGGTVLAKFGRSGTPAQAVEAMYLSTLSRRPTEAETKRMVEFIARQKDQREGYASAFWVLLNTSEFLLNH